MKTTLRHWEKFAMSWIQRIFKIRMLLTRLYDSGFGLAVTTVKDVKMTAGKLNMLFEAWKKLCMQWMVTSQGRPLRLYSMSQAPLSYPISPRLIQCDFLLSSKFRTQASLNFILRLRYSILHLHECLFISQIYIDILHKANQINDTVTK